MMNQKVIKLGKNVTIVECKNTITTAKVSAYISCGEILDITEGDWRTEETRFAKNDEETSDGTAQEVMACLIKDWPQFYGKVKRYALKDKLWSVAKAENFVREEKIKGLTRRIDNLAEELNALSKTRRRLQLPNLGKKKSKHLYTFPSGKD
jgi:hypothetical protein